MSLHQGCQDGHAEGGGDEAYDGIERGGLGELTRWDFGEGRDGQGLDNEAEGKSAQDEESLEPEKGRIECDIGALPGGEGKQEQAGQHYYTSAEAIHEATTYEAGDDGSEGLGEQEQTGLEGIEATQVLQVDGEDEEATEEGEGNERIRDIAYKEGCVCEQRDLDERLAAATGDGEFDQDEQGEHYEAREQEAEHDRRSPAIDAGLREGVEHRGESSSGQDEAEDIETDTCFRGAFAQEEEAEHDGNDAEGDVDEEDVGPIGVGHQIAAECRSDGGREQGGDTEDAAGEATLVGRKYAIEQGDGEREEEGAADALENAERDQDWKAPGESAERGAEGEDGEREQVEAFDADAIGEKGGDGRDHALCQGIGGDDPLDGIEVAVEGGF